MIIIFTLHNPITPKIGAGWGKYFTSSSGSLNSNFNRLTRVRTVFNFHSLVKEIPGYCTKYYQDIASFYILTNSLLIALLWSKAINLLYFFFFMWRCGPTRAMASSFLRFLDRTQRRSTVGRTSLEKWSAPHRDLYLTTHNSQHSHPCPRRDSNPQSQQASCRRPTP